MDHVTMSLPIKERQWFLCIPSDSSVSFGRHTKPNCVQVKRLAQTGGHFTSKHYNGELVDCVWNVMAHAQKPDFVFRRNGRVHLNRRGRQFSWLLAAEVCASTVVMLDTPCSEVVWRVLATHSICQFPIHFPSFASPCAITFQLDSTVNR